MESVETLVNPKEVLDFWFKELRPGDWFAKDEKLDEEVRLRFFDIHQKIAAGECEAWKNTPEGTLAYVIVLDQFSRNMFREQKESFAYDGAALKAAMAAVERGFDQELEPEKRLFLYMPYMHSESHAVHEKALEFFTDLGLEENLKYERLHKEIIDRFGRYPHRNKILGRKTTEEEQKFLDSDEAPLF